MHSSLGDRQWSTGHYSQVQTSLSYCLDTTVDLFAHKPVKGMLVHTFKQSSHAVFAFEEKYVGGFKWLTASSTSLTLGGTMARTKSCRPDVRCGMRVVGTARRPLCSVWKSTWCAAGPT